MPLTILLTFKCRCLIVNVMLSLLPIWNSKLINTVSKFLSHFIFLNVGHLMSTLWLLCADFEAPTYIAKTLRSTSICLLRPRQDRRYNADDIFKCILLNKNVWFPTKISLKFVSKGSITNVPPQVLIMALRRPGDKPLSEPMVVSLLTHICVTRAQWVRLRSDTFGWGQCLIDVDPKAFDIGNC